MKIPEKDKGSSIRAVIGAVKKRPVLAYRRQPDNIPANHIINIISFVTEV